MTVPPSRPTQPMKRHKEFSTWSIDETMDGEYHVLTLRIQGNIYHQTKSTELLKAYRQMLRYVANPLSRSVTIARLMGGEV